MQKVCLIIPCFNEEKRLNVKVLCDFIQQNKEVTLCFVNDGSKDGTLDILNSIKNKFEHVMVIHSDKNLGKAEAVRNGVLHVSKLNLFEFIGYWDADISTPLEEYKHLLDVFSKDKNILFVLGSRMKRLGSAINRKKMRHITGRIFSTFSSIILRLPVYDSQCGAKIFRSEMSDIFFKERFITKWLFDVELLARLRNNIGDKKILNACYEVPLNSWNEKGGSKLRFAHLIKVPYDLLKIHFYYNK